jgi:hypothetical protein
VESCFNGTYLVLCSDGWRSDGVVFKLCGSGGVIKRWGSGTVVIKWCLSGGVFKRFGIR